MKRRKLLIIGSIILILPIVLTIGLFGHTASAATTQSTYFTSYGYNDNDDGMGHYGNAIIANPCLHQIATETSGYYNDPVTYATDDRETAYCVKIYVPYLQKYFIHEDGCAECTTDWNNGQKWRTDLWIGDNTYLEDTNTLYPCEDSITRNDIMIINPPSNYVVDPTRMFHNNVCTAQLHGSTPITTGGNPTNTPKPAATSTPKPAATSTPKPGSTSTPKPAATSTPKPGSTSTPKPAATSTPKPQPTATTPSGVAPWDPNSHPYNIGDMVSYNGHTYKCIQAHTSQPGWDPASVPALWQFIS